MRARRSRAMGTRILLLALVTLSAVTADPHGIRVGEKAERRAFELPEVLNGSLSAAGFGGTWVSGTEFLYRSSDGSITQHDVFKTNGSVIDKNVMEQHKVDSYKSSADREYVLLGYDTEQGFRHSSSAKYLIYDSKTKNTWNLGGGSYLQLATWAPMNNSVVFVKDNNIYYRSSAVNGTEEIQLTNDGIPGIVYNGVPDWVYEEEVLGSGSALWISPNGQQIAFAQFNDTLVEIASYMHYGEPEAEDNQYTEVVNLRYPKPGTQNPEVKLKVIDVSALAIPVPEAVDLAPPDINSDILTVVTWAADDTVVAIWANRVQNSATVRRYNLDDLLVTNDDLTVSEPNGWVELPQPLFDSEGKRFLLILPQEQENSSGDYAHLTLVTPKTNVSNAIQTALTSGLFVVTNIYGWDTEKRMIYYQTTVEKSPSQRHVYSVSEEGNSTPKCLSCEVLSPENVACKFASASFSTDLTHFALTCSGPGPTFVGLYSTASSNELWRWENNNRLRALLEQRTMFTSFDETVPVTGFTGPENAAQVRLWLPDDIDKSGATKYPMIVFVYGGPSSVQVTDSFTLGWGAYLTTSRRYIYAMIDGRGSALKGNKMMFAINRKLGTVEVEDQINVARILHERHPFIDETRTGIWGWSYGGYATAMALAQDKDGVFKCGASVAPVTNWLYYDTIYTERYMGLPTLEDNQKGYIEGDITKPETVENFRDKSFFLLHGNADDNVHYQHAMMLSRALEKKDILFSQQSYPDENHRIASVLTHVYHSMDHFWSECFHLEDHSGAASVGAMGALTLLLLVVQYLLTG